MQVRDTERQVKEGFQVPSFLRLFENYGVRTDKEYGG